MNYDDYKQHLAAIDSLHARAKQIGQRLRPHHWKIVVDEFDADAVALTCYWPNYNDQDGASFPAEWLFRDDWERLVDERLSEEAAREEAKKADQQAEREAKERKELARLQEKYAEVQA